MFSVAFENVVAVGVPVFDSLNTKWRTQVAMQSNLQWSAAMSTPKCWLNGANNSYPQLLQFHFDWFVYDFEEMNWNIGANSHMENSIGALELSLDCKREINCYAVHWSSKSLRIKKVNQIKIFKCLFFVAFSVVGYILQKYSPYPCQFHFKSKYIEKFGCGFCHICTE